MKVGELEIMKLVIQRVKRASVSVDGKITGVIGNGLLVFLGISQSDTINILQRYVDKLIKMRIFSDEYGKTNLSILDVAGELLIVSQFTLYADCRKGNRPSFIHAGSPNLANALYEEFKSLCKLQVPSVESGIFGADMAVSLENDGPFTIVLDSDELNL